MENLIITIDGPAASGKSTVARRLAQALGASFLDTGAMYRAVTLAAMQAGVDIRDEKSLLHVIKTTSFQFDARDNAMMVHINGVDVTEQIREPQITANARFAAGAPRVREKLVQMQREFAVKEARVITEGRDQGTVAFPDADVKFYLTADATERAKRRQAELRDKGPKESLGQIQRAIEDRDKTDRNRTVGPLRPANDAVVIDTTGLTVEEVVTKALGYVRERCSKKSSR
jgi:cytidylate kinase